MGKIRMFFICVFFCFSHLVLAFSQTIILKSGQKVEGVITEQTDKYVKLDFQGVELIFYSEEISSIQPASSGGLEIITPQMELLRKAYTAALNAPKTPAPIEVPTKQATSISQSGLGKSKAPNLPGLSLKNR